MRRSLLPIYLCTICSVLVFLSQAQADIAIIAGHGETLGPGSNQPTYAVGNSFSIGQNLAYSIAMPTDQQVFLSGLAVDQSDGTTLYIGNTNLTNFPVVYRGSVQSSSVEGISVPAVQGYLNGVAFDSKGNAIIVGGEEDLGFQPIGYKLYSGASDVQSFSFSGLSQGTFNCVAVGPDDRVVIGGNDDNMHPVIYVLQGGSMQAIPVTVPNPSINCSLHTVAITSNGTALLGGIDNTNSQALIYTIAPGSFSANLVSIPAPSNGGEIFDIAVGPDGSAILVGSTTTAPLIYRWESGSSAVTLISNPSSNGAFYGVAIGSDNVAILGGVQDDFIPLICKIAPGASEAISIATPPVTGGIFSVAIGSDNIAVLAGSTDDSMPLVYTLSTTSTSLSSISVPMTYPLLDYFGVVVYSPKGLYDINRLKACYYIQLEETKNALRQAGM